MKLKQAAALLAFSVFSLQSVFAQTTTTCPAPNPGDANCYQTSRPGNDLVQWPPIPNQDCCNAIPLCLPYNIIENGVVIPEGAPGGTLYPGCVEEELPDPANTCFGNNEKGTTWFKFQIRPLNLPGAPTAPGSPAGKLRFKIIPKDVFDLPEGEYDPFLDLGSESYGGTDYDFLLFKIPASATSDGAACTVIRNSPTFGAPGSVIASCNWTGTRGPTGLFEPGTGTESALGPATRFNKPLNVKVGDIFYLAIDNFSVNVQGFDVDFRGLEAPDDSTAIVNPPPTDSIKIRKIDNPVCASRQFKIIFDKPVVCDSVKPGKFTVLGLLPNLSIASISPENGCNPGGQDTAFLFTLNYGIDPSLQWYDTTLQVFITQDIRDICGNKVLLESARLRLEYPVPLTAGLDSAKTESSNLSQIGLEASSCGQTKLALKFAKRVRCRDLIYPNKNNEPTNQKLNILLKYDSSGVSRYRRFGNITRIQSANKANANITSDTISRLLYDNLYIVSFDSAIVDTVNLAVRLKRDVVIDSCGNPVKDTLLPFKIYPFLNAKSTKELSCPGEISLTLTANAGRTYSLNANGQIASDSIAFSALRYQWFDMSTGLELEDGDDHLGGTIIHLGGNDNPKRIRINKPSPPRAIAQTYRVVATDLRNGCRDIAEIKVSYGGIVAKEAVVCAGEELTLNADFLSPLNPGISYKWTWETYKGDTIPAGTTPGNEVVKFRTKSDLFLDSLTQNAVLTYKLLSDTSGKQICRYVIPVKASVCPPPNLILPVLGASDNKKFFVKGIGKGQYDIKVYNRWGKLVDDAEFPVDGWDPKSKNVVPGNYFYILAPKEKVDGKPETFTGWFEVNTN